MGIGKLYFWATGLLGVYMCLGTHYKNYDGHWHRPRNQYKKEKEKAKEAAEAKAEKLASELGLDSTVASDNTRRHRRRDDTPTPAPRRANGGSRRDGDGSRARSRAPDASARRRDGRGRGRDRESDRSSSIAVGDSHAQYQASRASKQHASHRSSGGGARVKPTPYSGYIPEDDIFSPGPPSPLKPVNSTRNHHGYRKPADFAMEDHSKPGHTTRSGSYAPYKHLYGGYDDQYHAPFEGM